MEKKKKKLPYTKKKKEEGKKMKGSGQPGVQGGEQNGEKRGDVDVVLLAETSNRSVNLTQEGEEPLEKVDR